MNVKEKVADAGEAVGTCAKNFGQAVADGAAKAVDFVKEKVGIEKGKDFGVMGVKEQMEVVGCCGGRVGTVDHVEGNAIKLTKNGSPDGDHHYIPAGWVEKVDDKVHLSKNSEQAQAGWKATACAC
jgi:hypothetical protein